jgi:hypothetical protein
MAREKAIEIADTELTDEHLRQWAGDNPMA